jgi:hypothetical protein
VKKPAKKPEKVLDTDQAARYIRKKGLKMKSQTLRMYRYRKTGPVYQKPNGRVTYRPEDLDAYVERGQVLQNADKQSPRSGSKTKRLRGGDQ